MARKSRTTAASKSRSVSVNFKGVQSRQTLPEDDYLVEVTEAAETQSSSGNDQIEFVFKIASGKFEGQKLWFYCPLVENSLWKLHGLLVALGVDVPDDEMDIELDELVGLKLMAVVQHETYDGTKRSKMMDFYGVEGDGENEEADDKKSAGKGKTKELDKVSADKVEEMDREELEELIRTYSLDVDADEIKRLPKLVKAVVEALEEAGHIEEADGELEKLSADTIQDMSEEELEDVIKTYSLDVDLDDFKTLRKKAAAVIDKLEDAGHLKDE